ncbi:hypothetical protein EW026_g6757 [Hermanssonia centrifuga]|uniref:Elongator complex protein 1 n=1 Tax=Hermanssonia centrifuga TaxID=98765 RepID=A0A4S4KA03_9APHY|nr:hypothetical protein EW026_g6757 [Hermanssonia centrifuga]
MVTLSNCGQSEITTDRYLKHEIAAPPGQDGKAGRFTSVYWHPEDASTVFLTTASDVIKRSYIWDTFVSRSKPPHDSGSVVVLDGASILLTPFRTQNVPPPMSSLQLPLTSSPNAPKHQSRLPSHISFTPDKDIMTSLWETGYIELTDLHTRLGPGPGKVMDPVKLWTGYTVENQTNKAYRQILALVSEEPSLLRLAVLGSENKPDGKDVISLVVLKENEVQGRFEVVLPQRNGRLIPSDDLLFWQAPDGEIFAVDFKIGTSSPVAKFPRFYSYAEHASVPPQASQGNEKPSPSSLFIGLTPIGNLSVCTESEGEAGCHRILATNANSFIVASGFLVYTTTAHVAHFAPLAALSELLSNPDSAVASGSAESLPQWETRRVERGSRIVTAVPSTMSLVLQMPRGNLETINPRPLVMEIVKQDIDKADYAKAFAACRRHRVDLNVFVEHDKETLMGRLAEFVEQVENVDYINLFLTSIGQGTLPDDVVNQVCDRVRQELEKKDMKKYINSILTAHVMKRPADHEAGLDLLLRLRENEPGLVEDAVKYIIFLVDADRLFDTALGMYDFSLVLMVAQHAQKDPREYLPFLRELRALEKSYQRFKIDDHLKHYEKALRNLSLAGEDRFDEALAYVEKYQLYDIALSIWKDTERYDTMLSAYGDWLFERREFKDAAFVFRQASRFSKAMLAYEKALDWQELFDIAFSLRLQDQISEGDLVATAYSVAEGLSGKKRYQEAARVLLDYGKDVREAVISLVQGNHFSEARRIITMHSMLGLLEEIVYPGALESRAQIAEELGEIKEQLKKQVARLRELRVKKVEEPDAFYGVEDMELHNVDVMTDVSMAPTMFTRSKRKMERKVGSGRKGTVDEEEYLLRSVTKLVTRFNTTQAEAMNLLPHLFQFAEEHREEGRDLQRELEDFARELKESVDEIWKKPQDAEAEGETSAEGWAKRMQEYEKQRQIDPMDKVAKPELVKQEWNTQLSRVGLGMGSRK